MITIYGIANCDKVRQSKRFFDAHHIHYDFIDFRKHSVDGKQYALFVDKIGFARLINRQSSTWRTLTTEQKENPSIDLLIKYPTLIKRPVVVYDNCYSLGYDEDYFKSLLLRIKKSGTNAG